jgi:putative oxidoreductase
MNASAQRALNSLGLLIARAPIGALFFLAGLGKIRGGIGAFAQSQMKNLPSFLPTSLGSAYLHAVPIFELLVGLSMLLGLFCRVGAAVAALMLLSFMIAITGVIQPGPYLQTNLVLFGLAVALALMGPGAYSIDAAIFKTKRGDTAE